MRDEMEMGKESMGTKRGMSESHGPLTKKPSPIGISKSLKGIDFPKNKEEVKLSSLTAEASF